MADPLIWFSIALVAIAGIAIVVAALLRGWNGWLEVRHRELAGTRAAGTAPTVAARIEIADLRERVRMLEAIAEGIDPHARDGGR
jgi:hypothetical protein